jgi:geranyl-CoA carboxylase alpha subunit
LDDVNLALASVLFLIDHASDTSFDDVVGWSWSNAAAMQISQRLTSEQTDDQIALSFDGLNFSARFKACSHDITIHGIIGSQVTATIDGIRRRSQYAIDGNTLWLDSNGQTVVITNCTYQAVAWDEAGNGRIAANTEGLVIAVSVQVGDQVLKGDLLAVIEAMKMEHRLLADGDGVVSAVNARQGIQVKKGQVMVELTLAHSEADDSGEQA